jgi:heme/copper-type cytochrome/quinol oxidase subunit 2
MNARKPWTSVASITLAAVLLGVSTSGAAFAQDASAAPEASPTPAPGTWPEPSTSPLESFLPLDDDADGAVDVDGVTRTVTIEAGDLWYLPNEIIIPSGGPTRLMLVGTGQVAHNLMVDELELQLHVGPGITSEVVVSDLPPGTYEFYCSIFGHRRGGMYGTLTVE